MVENLETYRMNFLPGLFFFLSLTLFSTTHASFSEQSHINLPSDTSQKLTNLHFYYHDIIVDENPSIVQIINAPKNAPNEIGTTFVMDNALTEGPELSSKHIGRAQGLFGLASLEERWFFMLINLVFTEGEYGGSQLSMLGKNPVLEETRELPIVGGTGVFRFANGYAIAHSLTSISTPQHFVVEYNITVRHP